MSIARKIPLLAGLALMVVLVSVLLILTSPVQTWLVRQGIAKRPDISVEIERVSIGLKSIELEQIQADYAGAKLTLPRLEAELSVLPVALSQEVVVSRLVARGWTLDLTTYEPAMKVAHYWGGPEIVPTFSLISTAHAASAQPSAQMVFEGVLSQLQLPVELSLDGVVLEGEVILLAGPHLVPTKVQVSLIGGGFSSGHEGVFDLTSHLELSGEDAPVGVIDIQGTLSGVMDSPQTFVKLAGDLNAQAMGRAFPQGVQLTAKGSAARVKGGENYTLTMESVGKRLLDVQANYPDNSLRLGGVWRLDARDTDIAPFALGHALPTFEAVGAGMFETDTGFAEIHTAGRIKTSADRLSRLAPELDAVGRITIFGEFDLKQMGDITRVNRFTLDANQAEPVLKIEALQAFEFNAFTGELKVADPNVDLVQMEFVNMPLAWGSSFVEAVDLPSGLMRGRFTASARNGGLTISSAVPFEINGLSIASTDDVLLEDLTVSGRLDAEYTPHGWQAIIPEFDVASHDVDLISMSLRAGQQVGEEQPITSTGAVEVSLPALLQQPVARSLMGLNTGEVKMEFTSRLGMTQEYQAKVSVSDLSGPQGQPLPVIMGSLRAQVDEEAAVLYNFPVTCTREEKGRVSDLTLSGTLRPSEEGYHVEATLGAQTLYLDDLELLGAMAVGTSAATQSEVSLSGRDTKPFWHGVSGQVTLALKTLFYTEQFEMSDVKGTVTIDEGTMDLDNVQAGLGEESALKMEGEVRFDQEDPVPYTLAADMQVNDFSSGPLFRAINPEVPPQVDGQFSFTTQLAARGENAEDLLTRTQGDLQLTSKGGVFRLLSPKVSARLENTGRIAAVGAFLGSVMSRKKESNQFADRAQAVAQLSTMLTAIEYDQLNVSVLRGDDLNTVLEDFTLIAPEVRLAGNGQITEVSGVGILEQPLDLELEMKVRGQIGSAFKYLGTLNEKTDELGYTICQLPLRVSGTLAQPDTSELQSALTKLALDRSGANDFLKRLLGN